MVLRSKITWLGCGVLDRVAARVKNARPGEWIRGVGWDEGNVMTDLKCILTLLKGNTVYRDTQRLP